MTVGASIPPTANWLDTYKAAGLKTYTIVLFENSDGSFTYNEQSLINVLDLCYAKGLKAEIRLHSALTRTAGYNVFTDIFPNIHGELDEYPALTGFFIVDEPSWSQMENVENTYVPWFNEHYGGGRLEFFVNLLSSYSTAMGGLRDVNGNLVENNGTYKTGWGINALYEGSEAWLVGKLFQKGTVVFTEQEKSDFVKAYHNKWLAIFAKVNSANKCFSHDCYPFFDNQAGWLQDGRETALPEDYQTELLDGWFARSLNVANIARDNGYAFGAHIQVFDQGGESYPTANYRKPTVLAEIRWQVYMNLAMGAKRIDYFGYDQNGGGSYMTLAGQPLPIYYLVQQTNAELAKVEHVFASFETWLGVKTFAATGKTKSAGLQKAAELELDRLTGVSSVSSSGELVVGEMVDREGNHGYMLVGYSDPIDGVSTQVEMTFDGAVGFIVYRGGERNLVEAGAGGVFFTVLAAGDGVFVIPVYMD